MTDKIVLELKQAITENFDVGAYRQQLIYSGLTSLFSFLWSICLLTDEGQMLKVCCSSTSQYLHKGNLYQTTGQRAAIDIQDPILTHYPHGQRHCAPHWCHFQLFLFLLPLDVTTHANDAKGGQNSVRRSSLLD